MGFFKDVGNKLKRVVSLKNVVRGVTGNFSAVADDVKRVMTTQDPRTVKNAVAVNSLTDKNFVIPEPVQDVLKAQDSTYQQNLVKSIASIPAVQDANTFMSKLWIQSQWLKYKKWIIAGAVLLVGFLVWFFKFRKKHARKRSR
ncbi:hypothetical protein MCETHM1_01652 [Flavobacteriaceae bacterium]